MRSVNLDDLKFLREHTGMSLGECRAALEEAAARSGAADDRREDATARRGAADDRRKDAAGWREHALEILRERGGAIAEKKASRDTKEGRIEAYIHANGKIAAFVELGCETDFVARNELFRQLAHDLAMQVAAMAPASVEELLGQDFIREPAKTVAAHLAEAIAQLGENIRVTRFERWEL